jgi:uncharacterized protein involved in outer membrane biogenesis
MIRKWILRAALGLVVVLIAAFVFVAFSLGAIVKKTVERIGPTATKVEVTVKSAGVWLFAWRVELTGVFVGNPPGYKTACAITVEDVSVRIKPRSLFSNKLVVESISLNAPVITLEGGLRDNNLKKIEKNLDDYIGSSSTAPNSSAPSSSPTKPERKLEVDELEIKGAKLQFNTRLSGGRTITVPIPDIHLRDLGSGQDGITAVEVGQRTLDAVLNAATTAIAKNATQLGTQGANGAKNAAQKAADKIKSWFH